MGFFSPPSHEKRKKRRGLLRAAAYLAALSGVFSLVQVRQARAEVGDRTVEVGRQMMVLANATQHDVNKLVLNGQSMFMGSSLSVDNVAAVLDRYESTCQKNRAQSGDEWKKLLEQSAAPADRKAGTGNGGIVRSGDDTEGAVICFTKTGASKATFSEAVHTFAQTGELGALGAVRYVYARKSEKGNTVVLTAWTDEQFNLKSFMGDKTKDCAGEDFAGLPRPKDSIRVISGRVAETPFGVNIYRSKNTPGEVASAFDATLTKDGWAAIDPELEKMDANDKHHPVGRIYEKDGVVLSMASHLEPDSTFTTMGLAAHTAGMDTGTDKKPKLKAAAPPATPPTP
jgi:hypothetical protein